MKQKAPQTSETLARQAYAVLQEMILTLDLKPGAVINEKSLIEQTGFGRTPLREALLRLARERLVRVLPRKGIIVSEINPADFTALLETRSVLDELIALRAAKRVTGEQRTRLKDIASRMESAAKKNQLRDYMRLDEEFDTLIEEACRNPFAVRAVKPLHAHCRRFWFQYQHAGDLAKAARLHMSLMKSISASESKKISTASSQLIGYLSDFTRTAISP